MTRLDLWLIILSVVSLVATAVIWSKMMYVNISIHVKQNVNIHVERNPKGTQVERKTIQVGNMEVERKNIQVGNMQVGNMQVGRKNISRLEPFVFSLNYWEQLGNALKNLFDIQCWAKSVHIDNVLEPAIMSTPGNAFLFSVEPKVTFTSYFDPLYWNSINRAFNNSVLVPLEHFWARACRRVILIQLLIDKNSVCQPQHKFSQESWYKALKKRGFVIKSVCIDTEIKMLDDIFSEKILKYRNSSPCTTILFKEWRGISATKNFRLQLQRSRCQNTLSRLMSSKLTSFKPEKIVYPNGSQTPVRLSEQIIYYRNKFLTEFMSGENYVAVMIRSERLDKSLLLNQSKSSSCIKDVVRDHKEALRLTNATRTLYFTDLGPHGSNSWKDSIRLLSAISFSNSLESSISPFHSTGEIDDQLKSLTNSNDSILIALLHSAIATKAEALVMLGEGAFHILTLNFHAHDHIGRERYFIRNSQCSRRYLHHFYA